MSRRSLVVVVCLLAACSHRSYEIGMHREDVYERVDGSNLEAFVSEVRLGQRHDLIVVPQGGFRQPHDERILSGERGSFFSRFRPTETGSAQYREWLELYAAVRIWHGVIFEDLRVVAVIDDEQHERLLDRVADWMLEAEPNFDRTLIDPIRVRIP